MTRTEVLSSISAAKGISEDGVDKTKMLEIVRELCESAEIRWTELLGKHMLGNILSLNGIPDDRPLKMEEVVCVVEHFKKVPRQTSRVSGG